MDSDTPPTEGPEPEPPVKPRNDPSLPPVQPPTAGFLLQLFLIPMIIVTIILGVWLAFSWLAHLGTDPRDLARDLRKVNDASWQKAHTLSVLLQNPKYDELKDDEELAAELATTLDRLLDEGSDEPHRVQLRMYLARTLGEFRVPVVADTLLQAASQEKSPKDLVVRRGAIQALAVLSQNADVDRAKVLETVLEASRERAESAADREETEQRDNLRSEAAFALGTLGGDQALDRLESMQMDRNANVRFNAASGLARNGDVRSIPVLQRMLQPDNEAAIEHETEDGSRTYKRLSVLTIAMQSVRRLARTNPEADLQSLATALETLVASDVELDVKLAAKETLALLRERDNGS